MPYASITASCAALVLVAVMAPASAAALPAFMGANGHGATMLVAQAENQAENQVEDQAQDIGEDKAADIAASASGGRVLGVEWIESGPAAYYAVRVLLADGVVKTIRVGAQSGEVIE